MAVSAEKALPKDLASLPGKRDAGGFLLRSELTVRERSLGCRPSVPRATVTHSTRAA